MPKAPDTTLTTLCLPTTYLRARRERIQALRASEIQFRDTVENAVEGIIRTSAKGEFVYVNPSFARMLGYDSPAEVLESITDVSHQVYVDPEVRRDFLMRLNRDGQARCEYEAWKKDGTTTWLSVSSRVVHDQRDHFLYFESIAEDISERRHREAKLVELTCSLAKSNAELQHFAHMVAHDLNQPLRTIVGYGQVLANNFSQTLGEEGAQCITYMSEAALRMSELIDDILTLSQLHYRPTPSTLVDMNEVVREVWSDLQAAVRESCAEMEIEKLPWVWAHKSKLQRLIQNLLSNSLKFRGEHPVRISVSAALKGNHWVFEVRDNGIGFEEASHEKIFEFFVQLNDRRQFGGTGMGLAMCKRIVELYGGRIWAHSTPGSGSSFFFSLPELGNKGSGNPDSTAVPSE